MLVLTSGALAAEIPEAPYRPGHLNVKFKPGVAQADIDALNAKAGGHFDDYNRPASAEVHSIAVPVGQEAQALAIYQQSPIVAYAEYDYLSAPQNTTSFTVPSTLNSDVLLGEWWQQFADLFGEP
jgi:hypothetical protein